MRIECFLVVLASFLAVVRSLPTMYKLNEKHLLEADLVPVSSTVIPLPIYQVSSGFGVSGKETEKHAKPLGHIPLLTHSNYKKKLYPKPKPDDVSIVKEISKKEFHN